MGFDIDYGEVAKLDNDYQIYVKKLGGNSDSGALGSIGNACRHLGTLNTFNGQSAQSIKRYFLDVHLYLSCCIADLAGQLLQDYTLGFCNKFEQGPVNETHSDARWPSEEMSSAVKKIKALQDGDLKDAKSHLRDATRLLPSGFGYTISSPTALEEAIEYEMTQTTKINQGVASIDSEGKSILSKSDCEFANLARAISAAISACATISGRTAGRYDGSFSAIAQSTGLVIAVDASRASQGAHKQELIDSCKKLVTIEQENIAIASEAALQKKKTAANIGLSGSILGLAGATMGAVAVIGAIVASAPVLVIVGAAALATLGVAGAMTDTWERSNQVIAMNSGDVLADKTEENKLGKIASDTTEFVAKTQKAKAWLEKGDIAETNKAAGGLVGWVVGDVEKEVLHTFEDEAGLSDEQSAWLDGGFELAETGESEYIKQVFGASANTAQAATGIAFSAVGKAVTVVSDYYVEEADKELETLQRRSSELSKLDDGPF